MECYASKVKLLGLLGLTCVMAGMCYFLATMPDLVSRVVGWIGIVFFGLGFIAFPVMFFRTGPQVVINDQGILDHRLKIGVIPWEDIRSISIRSIESVKFLRIDVADPEKYLSARPWWRRHLTAATEALGFSALTIGFSGLRPGLKEVWSYLQAREPSKTMARLEPESRFILRVSESEVVCERPDGRAERIRWHDLQKMEVITTGDGPFAPDVFWVLHGTNGGCVVPQGATGEKELLERLQALPGFDNAAFIEAMLSVSERRFLCWQRAA